MAEIIDGTALAARLNDQTAVEVQAFQVDFGRIPGLAVVLVGTDAASEIYVKRKLVQSHKVGLRSFEFRLPADTTQSQLLSLIDDLNRNKEIDGILIQLPLPDGLESSLILDRIDPAKDVDGFHPVNVGRLSSGSRGLVPCTPLGCLKLLDTVFEDYRGLNALVIGKSNVVGKPVAMLLLERGATVTVAHIDTVGLSEIARKADIIVSATGAPHLVRGYWVKPGAVVIDVGIARIREADGTSKIVGDCVTHELDHAAAVTPVPGGVGPMTIACLLSNTLQAAHVLQTGA